MNVIRRIKVEKAKKYIVPILVSLGVLCAFLLLTFVVFEKNDYGSLLIILFFLIFVLFIGLPIYCRIYTKKILFCEKRKYLFAFYNSLVITMAYFLPLCAEGETYLYSIVLFIWAEFWSISPLLFQRENKNPME